MGRYGVRQRRAVRAARFWRSSVRYESRRDPLTTLRQRMRELAQTRVRFGYRRLLVVMHREGWEVGKHRFYRLYTEEAWRCDGNGRGAMRPPCTASSADPRGPATRSGAWTSSRTNSPMDDDSAR